MKPSGVQLAIAMRPPGRTTPQVGRLGELFADDLQRGAGDGIVAGGRDVQGRDVKLLALIAPKVRRFVQQAARASHATRVARAEQQVRLHGTGHDEVRRALQGERDVFFRVATPGLERHEGGFVRLRGGVGRTGGRAAACVEGGHGAPSLGREPRPALRRAGSAEPAWRVAQVGALIRERRGVAEVIIESFEKVHAAGGEFRQAHDSDPMHPALDPSSRGHARASRVAGGSDTGPARCCTVPTRGPSLDGRREQTHGHR